MYALENKGALCLNGGVKDHEPRGDQSQPSVERGGDYRAMLSSIRADQDRETFVADLHRNKEQLLSLAQNLMRNRGNTPEENSAYLSVGIYLDVVLKEHVFNIDPFESKRPGDEQVQEDRQVLAHDLLQRIAFDWFMSVEEF